MTRHPFAAGTSGGRRTVYTVAPPPPDPIAFMTCTKHNNGLLREGFDINLSPTPTIICRLCKGFYANGFTISSVYSHIHVYIYACLYKIIIAVIYTRGVAAVPFTGF